ncbi:hypothetical protein FACS1894105_06520 [Clostridia bacterium]|nr:hypothetical protein FACS1894105_06520 [Clostridia bacterium]
MDSFNPYELPEDGGGKNPAGQIRVTYKTRRGASKKSGTDTVNAGGAIIIIIFVVLCLTIFGLLSFTTSFADKKLADRNLRNVEQYYAADSAAEEMFTKIYEALYVNTRDGEFWFSSDYVSEVLANIGGDIEVRAYDSDYGDYSPDRYNFDENPGKSAVVVSYYCDMSDVQAVSVVVEFIFDADTDTLTHRIAEWKVVLTKALEYEPDTYDLFMYDDFEY